MLLLESDRYVAYEDNDQVVAKRFSADYSYQIHNES